MPRTARWRPRRASAPSPGRAGTRRMPVAVRPDGLGQEGVAALGRPAGRVVRELDERPAADARRDVQVGQQPDPVRPGVRREPAVRARGPAPRWSRPRSMPAGEDRRRAGRRRRRPRRAPPATRRTSASSRRRRSGSRAPRRAGRQPAQVGASRAAPRATARRARPARPRCGGRRPGRARRVVSPAIRQPWLRSTMIAIVSPTAARVAATAASPSSSSRGSTRIFSGPEALVAQAQRGLGARRGRQQRRRTRRRPGCRRVAPPNSVATGRPATWPAMSQSATSSGQYRPAWKSIVSRTPDVARDGQRVLADEQVLERPRSRPSCRPTRCPTTPSSVSTRTIVDREARRVAPGPRRPGTADRAGSAGARARMRGDPHASTVSPTALTRAPRSPSARTAPMRYVRVTRVRSSRRRAVRDIGTGAGAVVP